MSSVLSSTGRGLALQYLESGAGNASGKVVMSMVLCTYCTFVLYVNSWLVLPLYRRDRPAAGKSFLE